MAWIHLLAAGVLEIVWAFAMKQSDGFSKLTPSIITLVTMIASFWLLSLAMRTLPLGTAYTIWTGIGALGVATLGIVLFGDSASLPRLACVGLIVAGVIGLKLVGG